MGFAIRRSGKFLKAMNFWAVLFLGDGYPSIRFPPGNPIKLTIQLGGGDTLRVSHKMLDNKA
ncbi:hypothetical protein [Pseudomonas alkylphenolica]|uniref:hypothetical protein n=1 Tax=Pseudomonas alkylphenolica TaxID=237609 RepID=UPI0012FDA1C9|nr:hypothetical protein [Pseudomonas alkylphenolica]